VAPAAAAAGGGAFLSGADSTMPVTRPLVDTLPSNTNLSLLPPLLPSLLPARALLSHSLISPSLLAVAMTDGN
jgi:hypothetical protein